MKERAIVIFEFEEKEEREKNRAEVMELTAGRDGSSAVFSSSDKLGHAQRIFICNKKQKGIQHWYHLLMRTNKTFEARYQM